MMTALRAQSGDNFDVTSSWCESQCANCPPAPECAPGVLLVSDGGPCNCCKRCAGDYGEQCSVGKQCNTGLYCSYPDIDSVEGVCMHAPGRGCRVDDRLYYEGETFKKGCMETCTCLSGKIACTPECPLLTRANPPKNCLQPRLMRRKNPCCLEWVCGVPYNSSMPVVPDSRFHSTHKVRRHRERSAANRAHHKSLATVVRHNNGEEPMQHGGQKRCVKEETQWTACSKTCGWGLSYKYSNDNSDCKSRKVTRFCQIRPCDVDLTPKRKRGKRCQRVVKAPRRVRFSYKGCKSKSFVPKYCGQCVDGRCCQVKNEVTVPVLFTCPGGSRSFKRPMMIIKSCECRSSCGSGSGLVLNPLLDFST